jgi:hypothetical protein
MEGEGREIRRRLLRLVSSMIDALGPMSSYEHGEHQRRFDPHRFRERALAGKPVVDPAEAA